MVKHLPVMQETWETESVIRKVKIGAICRETCKQASELGIDALRMSE